MFFYFLFHPSGCVVTAGAERRGRRRGRGETAGFQLCRAAKKESESERERKQKNQFIPGISHILTCVNTRLSSPKRQNPTSGPTNKRHQDDKHIFFFFFFLPFKVFVNTSTVKRQPLSGRLTALTRGPFVREHLKGNFDFFFCFGKNKVTMATVFFRQVRT